MQRLITTLIVCISNNPSFIPPLLGYQPKASDRKALAVIGALEEKDVIKGGVGR